MQWVCGRAGCWGCVSLTVGIEGIMVLPWNEEAEETNISLRRARRRRGAELSPRNICWNPNPSSTEHDLSRNTAFTEVIKWKWGHWGALIQKRLVSLLKGGHLGRDRHTQKEDTVKTQGEDVVWPEWCVYRPRNTEDWQQTLETRRAGKGFPVSHQRMWPASTLILDF